jgi:hypothetical protein
MDSRKRSRLGDCVNNGINIAADLGRLLASKNVDEEKANNVIYWIAFSFYKSKKHRIHFRRVSRDQFEIHSHKDDGK